MKLFHIDRGAKLQVGTIELFDNYTLPPTPPYNEICRHVKELYPQGISEHGNLYIFEQMRSSVIENIFELVRVARYPDCLSRFQSFFAVDARAVKPLIAELCSEAPNYKVWEVEAKRFQKFDMHLLGGATFAEGIYYADRYWKQESSGSPLYEYLLQPPITVRKELSMEEIDALEIAPSSRINPAQRKRKNKRT